MGRKFGSAVGGAGKSVGRVVQTVGDAVGTGGCGVGATINNTTGTRDDDDGLLSVTDGPEGSIKSSSQSAENPGEWKKK